MTGFRYLRIAFLTVLCACTTARDRAVVAANSVATFADGAHDIISERYESALGVCLDMPDKPSALECGEAVRDRFKPLWDAYRTLRIAWLSLAAYVHSHEAGGIPMKERELAEQLASLAKSVREFKRIHEGLDR